MATHVFAPISAFLFDMDGTLVESHEVVERCWRRWGQQHGVDPEKILAFCHGRQARATISHFRPDLDTEQEVRRMLDWELREPGGTRPIPGAAEFLAQLPPNQWAVVTSASRSLAMHRLEQAQLPRPSVLFAAEDVLRSKPDPEGFLAAARELHAETSESLVFEDSLIGLRAGRQAGMPTLQICVSQPPRDPASLQRCMDYRDLTLSTVSPASSGRKASFSLEVKLCS